MAYAGFLARATRKAPPSSAQSIHVPPPMGSINTIAAEIPPEDCVLRYNLIPAEYGLRLRLGSKEWCTGLTGGAVRTIIPFSAASSGDDKVFATTSTGIWDVTASSATPTESYTFGTSDTTSGYGVFTTMVTAAGHFLVYCDESNGALIWNGSAWAAMTLTGVTAGNIVAVCAHKNRLWFVEKNTGKAWYLPTNAISGTVTSYNMGARFKAGGSLVGLWSWTYDGGGGIDDALVAISSGGDVLVYQGTDPSTLGLWQLRGVWQVGALPAGRTIASDLGGDLLVMTRHGILPMSRLVLGSVQGDSTQYATIKVSSLWNKWMLTRAASRGWQMVQSPEDASVIVIAPNGESVASDQLVMSMLTKGWSQYRDLGMGNCAATYNGKLWYGTVDGKIRILDGYQDGRTIADPTTTTPITGSLLTGFATLGTPRQKRLSLVRPTWVSDTAEPEFQVEARYGWDLAEATTPAAAAASGPNTWDTGVWDTAVWGGDYMPTQAVRGLTGCGAQVALALKVRSQCRTILTGFDVSFTVGGLL